MANSDKRLLEALSILSDLGMPTAQKNERSALCLLAILDLTPAKSWAQCSAPLIGITPMMEFASEHYGKDYKPNSRESFRRESMHQFIQGGIALYNPDNHSRPVNSPKAVYQIVPECLAVMRKFGSADYPKALAKFNGNRETLAQQYAMHRDMEMVPLVLADGQQIKLSAGAHSELIRDICAEFGNRFIAGGKLVYAGDTGEKWGYFDIALLKSLGVSVDNHGKMPDVVIYDPARNWLILAEAVTSHGPVNSKRHSELNALFKGCKAGLVFVSAFPDRATFNKYSSVISWETEVWIADNPSHMIHFNGIRFLGPYRQP